MCSIALFDLMTGHAPIQSVILTGRPRDHVVVDGWLVVQSGRLPLSRSSPTTTDRLIVYLLGS